MAQPGCFATLLMLFASIFGFLVAMDDPADEAIYIEQIFLPHGTSIYDAPDGNAVNSTPEDLFWAGIGTDESGKWVYGFYIFDDMVALEGWVESSSDNLTVIENLTLLRDRALNALVPNTENRNVDS